MRKQTLWTITLMLILAACNQSAITPSPTRNGIVVLPATATSLPIVIETPTPIKTQIPDCPAAPPARLIIQERGRVTSSNDDRLRLRRGPGVEYDQLTAMEAGAIFFVLDGPACSGDYTWYRVRYRSWEGWAAEGDFEEYYAEPYLPG